MQCPASLLNLLLRTTSHRVSLSIFIIDIWVVSNLNYLDFNNVFKKIEIVCLVIFLIIYRLTRKVQVKQLCKLPVTRVI